MHFFSLRCVLYRLHKLWHFQIYLVGTIVRGQRPLVVLPAVRLTSLRKLRLLAVLLTSLRKLRLPAVLPISLRKLRLPAALVAVRPINNPNWKDVLPDCSRSVLLRGHIPKYPAICRFL
mgnify:FL=1